jgi:hypothetical protein
MKTVGIVAVAAFAANATGRPGGEAGHFYEPPARYSSHRELPLRCFNRVSPDDCSTRIGNAGPRLLRRTLSSGAEPYGRAAVAARFRAQQPQQTAYCTRFVLENISPLLAAVSRLFSFSQVSMHIPLPSLSRSILMRALFWLAITPCPKNDGYSKSNLCWRCPGQKLVVF